MHEIIISVIGCGVLNVIVTAIIGAVNNRKGRLKAVEDKLEKVDRRLDAIDRNLAIGERYFGTLRGNWYATSLFNNWLSEKDIARPEWFKED